MEYYFFLLLLLLLLMFVCGYFYSLEFFYHYHHHHYQCYMPLFVINLMANNDYDNIYDEKKRKNEKKFKSFSFLSSLSHFHFFSLSLSPSHIPKHHFDSFSFFFLSLISQQSMDRIASRKKIKIIIAL